MRWVTVLSLCLFASYSQAAWGPSGCSAVVENGWVNRDGATVRYDNGIMVEYKRPDGVWFDWVNGGWVQRGNCNCDKCDNCKCARQDECKIMGADIPNFGMVVNKLHAGKCCINGVECSKKQACDAVAQSIDDVSGRLHLTAIGKQSDLDTFKQKTSNLHDKYLVRTFTPDAWALKDKHYVTTGTPTIYLQDGKGEVLARRDDGNVDAVLAYDPAKDPGNGGNNDMLLQHAIDFFNAHTLLCVAAVAFVAWRFGFLDKLLKKG